MPAIERTQLIDSYLSGPGTVYVHPNITENTGQFREKVAESELTVEELIGILDQYDLKQAFTLDDRIFYEVEYGGDR